MSFLRTFACVVALLPIVAAQTPPEAKPGIGFWTQFRGDAASTGVSHSPRPAYKGVKWKHFLGGPSTSTPAVVDGKVIVATEAGWLTAVAVKDGTRIWQKKLACEAVIASSPLIIDGRIYIGTRGGHVICSSVADGALVWTHKTGSLAVYASPKGDARGIVFGDMNGVVWCLDPATGAVRWQSKALREVASSVSMLGDNLYVASRGRALYELNYKDGAILRTFELPKATASTPALGMGFAYLMCGSDLAVAIDLLEGRMVWTHSNALDDQSSAAFADGTVYMPLGQHLKAMNGRTGEVLWTCLTNHKIGPPVINGDDILIACRDKVFRVVDRKTGKVTFELAFDEGFVSGPVVVDGVVYLAADMDMGVHLYAIE
ncbi:MAG: hypothetical protein EXS14_03185 [Planctomycetes bacterium]|nr:hypothetical protein [Planctomycetota bacterium]